MLDAVSLVAGRSAIHGYAEKVLSDCASLKPTILWDYGLRKPLILPNDHNQIFLNNV